jgi:hypothetical protein
MQMWQTIHNRFQRDERSESQKTKKTSAATNAPVVVDMARAIIQFRWRKKGRPLLEAFGRRGSRALDVRQNRLTARVLL